MSGVHSGPQCFFQPLPQFLTGVAVTLGLRSVARFPFENGDDYQAASPTPVGKYGAQGEREVAARQSRLTESKRVAIPVTRRTW